MAFSANPVYGTGTYNARLPSAPLRLQSLSPGGVSSPLAFYTAPKVQQGTIDEEISRAVSTFMDYNAGIDSGGSGGTSGGVSSGPAGVGGIGGAMGADASTSASVGAGIGQAAGTMGAAMGGFGPVGAAIGGTFGAAMGALGATNSTQAAQDAALDAAISAAIGMALGPVASLAYGVFGPTPSMMSVSPVDVVDATISPVAVSPDTAISFSDMQSMMSAMADFGAVSDAESAAAAAAAGPGGAPGEGASGVSSASDAATGTTSPSGTDDGMGAGSVGAAAGTTGDSAADAGGEGSADGSAGAGGSVICTSLHRNGHISDSLYKADSAYGRKLALYDPAVYVGYRRWSDTVVRWMESDGIVGKIVLPLVKFIVMPIITAMASKEDSTVKSSAIGRFLLHISVAVCRYLGKNHIHTVVLKAGI